MRTRSSLAAAAAAMVMTLGACSSGPPVAAPGEAAPSTAAEDVARTPDGRGDSPAAPGGKDGRRPRDKRSDRPESGNAGGPGDASTVPSGGGRGGSGASGGRSGGSGETFALPPEGTYGYAQEGYEEFCQGRACDRTPLPASQRVEIDHGERSDSAATLTSVAHQSSRTKNTTDFRVTDGLVEITRLAVEVNYNGFRYAETYEPQPAIHALELPLRAGAGWSGSWDAQVYGDYTFKVEARESIEAGGRTFDAFRIRTDVELHGELEGFVKATIWIDPETGGILKSESLTHTKSAFGTYEALVNITLSSGP